MRDNESWKRKALPLELKLLPKRIQNDLETITLDNLPRLGNYYIQGPVGSGKTLLAACMLLEAKRHRFLEATSGDMLFITVPEFLNMIKATYDDPEENEQAVLNKFSEADFLVLDDFGAERTTDWAMSMLYLLINRRYEEMRTTVFTSNIDLQELAEKLGDERIPARIERMCKIINKTEF